MKAIKKIKEYLLLNEIGRGSFGKVYEALNEKNNKLYAIKALASDNFKNPRILEQLKKELKILFSLNHQNIMKIIGVEKTINNIYLILEYCNGGTLLDYITYFKKVHNKNIPEEIIQKIIKQIIKGLKYMHQNNVIHRDIKLENILINFPDYETKFTYENNFEVENIIIINDKIKENNKKDNPEKKLLYNLNEKNETKNTKYFQNLNDFINSRKDTHHLHKIYQKKNLMEDEFTIKIADLGYAKILDQSEGLSTICGTPLFMAPDIINLFNKESKNKNYNTSIDIWSLGIVFYELLMGIPPFSATYNNEIFKKILAGVYKIPKNLKVSVEAMSFLTGLIEFYPDRRFKIGELELHPFISKDVKNFIYIHTEFLEHEFPNETHISIDSKETSSLLLKIIKYFRISLPTEDNEKKVLYSIINDKIIEQKDFEYFPNKINSENNKKLINADFSQEIIINVRPFF